jgi:hypothetical protein
MHARLNRRRFTGWPLAVILPETLPESPARPSRTAELIERYKALMDQHQAASEVYDLRYTEAVAVIGACPRDVEGNQAWRETFRETPANAALFALEAIGQEMSEAITELYNASPAKHPRQLALKLRLWLEDDSLQGDHYPLWRVLGELEDWPL